MMYINDVINDRDRKTILDIAIKMMLRYGTGGYLKSLQRYLPYWKSTHLYDKGIIISRKLLMDTAPKWKMVDRIRKMDWPDHLPYSRDFYEGIIDAGCTPYKNGVYTRLEFSYSKKHLIELFESVDVNCRERKEKFLCRTANIPFLAIEPKGELENYFIGVLCGASVYIEDDGRIRMLVRKKCEPNLRKLGIFYDTISSGLLIDCFYLMLFMADLPDPVMSYWMGQFPLRRVACMKSSSIVANIHWRLLFNHDKQIREGLPFLLEARDAWRIGVTRDFIKEEMKRRRMDFVDERVRKRCLRWAALKKDEAVVTIDS